MTTLTGRLSPLLPSREDYPVVVLIGLWLLAMIALPIARWLVGDNIINVSVFIAAVCQVIAVFGILANAWGVRSALSALLIVGAGTWVAEAVGSATGVPFGYYHYTDLLQPQVAGVPLLIPLAWFMMLPSAWAVAQLIVGKRSRLLFILVSAVALTAWDLFLDPQKVAWGFWVWTDGPGGAAFSGGYFGIPWVNFLGWILVASIVTWLVNPAEVPERPLLLIYGIVWIFQTLGMLLFWNIPGPALVGFLGMGSMLLLAWLRNRQRPA
jgi:putative membrane protein